MTQVPDQNPKIETTPINAGALSALVLSILGCLGWIALLVLLQPYDNNAERNIGAAAGNVLKFGFNFLLLVAGAAISGTLSFSGLLTGAVSLGNANGRWGYAAVALGAIGLLAGAVLVIWRFDVVFG